MTQLQRLARATLACTAVAAMSASMSCLAAQPPPPRATGFDPAAGVSDMFAFLLWRFGHPDFQPAYAAE